MSEVEQTKNVIEATALANLSQRLDAILHSLSLCEKALAEYLETKRLVFPRFYFCSAADLLDILSNGNQPKKVERHLTKLFDSIARLKFVDDDVTQTPQSDVTDEETAAGGDGKVVNGMWSKDGEFVDLCRECQLTGQVPPLTPAPLIDVTSYKREVSLGRSVAQQVVGCDEGNGLARTQRGSDGIRGEATRTVHLRVSSSGLTLARLATAQPLQRRSSFLGRQVALVGSQINWTSEVHIAFARLEEGYENALKEYNRKQVTQLNALIALLLGASLRTGALQSVSQLTSLTSAYVAGDLSKGDRQKIMTICTIDVHARDVVSKLIAQKVTSVQV